MLEIKILGQKVPIKATDNDPEFTEEVISLVSKRIELAESRLKGTRLAHQVTLLALLDLAEEYVRAKRRTVDYQTEIEARATRVQSLLDAHQRN